MCAIAKLKLNSQIFHDLFITQPYLGLIISTLKLDGDHTLQVIDIKLLNVLVRGLEVLELWVHNQLA